MTSFSLRDTLLEAINEYVHMFLMNWVSFSNSWHVLSKVKDGSFGKQKLENFPTFQKMKRRLLKFRTRVSFNAKMVCANRDADVFAWNIKIQLMRKSVLVFVGKLGTCVTKIMAFNESRYFRFRLLANAWFLFSAHLPMYYSVWIRVINVYVHYKYRS